jgi:hypothetical protein
MAVRLSALTRRPPFTSRKIPGIHFCWRMNLPQGHSAAGRIRSIEKFNDIGTRTRDLPASSILPQPTTPPRAHTVGVVSKESRLLVLPRTSYLLLTYRKYLIRKSKVTAYGLSFRYHIYTPMIRYLSLSDWKLRKCFTWPPSCCLKFYTIYTFTSYEDLFPYITKEFCIKAQCLGSLSCSKSSCRTTECRKIGNKAFWWHNVHSSFRQDQSE